MDERLWFIAMRRVELEFDIPQSVGASIVREVFDNDFRLPPQVRSRYSQLPDAVIERIEQIVYVAHLEEQISRSREDRERSTVFPVSRSELETLASDCVKLLSRKAFCERLGITGQWLDALVAKGSLFALDVEGDDRFPSVLADPSLGRRRLHSLCRILVPAPAAARLAFLVSCHASLGGLSPVEILRTRKRFSLLREVATACAADWSRTSVQIFIGRHLALPELLPPIYVAIDEVDPRRDVWKRIEGAMQAGGYIAPDGPYPLVSEATVFVVRQPAGSPSRTIDARIEVTVDGRNCRALFELPSRGRFIRLVALEREDLNIVEVISAIADTLKRR